MRTCRASIRATEDGHKAYFPPTLASFKEIRAAPIFCLVRRLAILPEPGDPCNTEDDRKITGVPRVHGRRLLGRRRRPRGTTGGARGHGADYRTIQSHTASSDKGPNRERAYPPAASGGPMPHASCPVAHRPYDTIYLPRPAGVSAPAAAPAPRPRPASGGTGYTPNAWYELE